MLLSRTVQSRKPSLLNSCTQNQALKALVLRPKLRRVKSLEREILLELLNIRAGNQPQQLGAHPQIHILLAFEQ